MPRSNRIEREFFNRNTLDVARALLGQRLVKLENGRRLAGIITECEAYCGEEDLGCHAKAGMTTRTRVMYGPPGHAYVYFTYGMHWMLNFVTEREGFPAAVLLRGLLLQEGKDIIEQRRLGQPENRWTDGPGKICKAFKIDRFINGADLCSPDAVLFLEYSVDIPEAGVTKTARVGLNNVPEPWKSIPWRFQVAENFITTIKEDT
jgi:DNA-3-methyladenine glycosylase